MDKKSSTNPIFFTIVTGACGIVAQTILLREMLILFSGNELSIGVIIGSWILWEAFGAYFAGKKHFKKETIENALIILTIAFSLFFIVSIYIARVFKLIVGIPLDTGAGILQIFYASFFVLFPSGFLHGMLFTLICSFFNELMNDGKQSIGRVYFYEMLGTIIGGIILNYFLIQYFNAFTIAVTLNIISVFSCLFLLIYSSKKNNKGLVLMVVMSLFAFIILISTGGTKVIHNFSISKQWSERQVVYYKNTLYQNIVVVKDHEQYTFFTDGVLAITVPTPDITYIEDLVHITLLSHKKPENILVMSKGAGGIINEIIKHRTVKKIDYVETDPQFLKTIELFSNPILEKELKNPFVFLHFIDGRIFLKASNSLYDVIFINVSLPYTLQHNRFFTKEFFENVKGALKTDGIGVLTLPGSRTYYTEELKNLHACILKTIKSVFQRVFILPGDYNLIIFTEEKNSIITDPEKILKNLIERKIESKVINRIYLIDRFDKTKTEWYLSNLRNINIPINTDFSPAGFFYTITYNNLLYSPYLKNFFNKIQYLDIKKIIVGILIFSSLFFIIPQRHGGIPILFSIGTTGLTSIILELILIFGFQIYFGYVFYEVGILVTVFLSGIALGGILAIAPFIKKFRDITVFRIIEATLIIISISVFFILKYWGSDLKVHPFFTKATFFIFLFITGLCTGMEFPTGSRLYGENSKGENKIGRVVGHLYSIDLIGGCIGGFIGGIILSIIGIANGCMMLALLKALSLLLILLKLRDP